MADASEAPPLLELEQEDAVGAEAVGAEAVTEAIDVGAEAVTEAIDVGAEAVTEAIDAWLATIDIGGSEERGFDGSDLARFAVEHGLQGDAPELIYKAFVDLRVGTTDAREKDLAKEKLAAGVALKIEDKAAGKSFVLDEELRVVSLAQGGAAQAAGVALGMRLIGFQEELVERNVKWARLRTHAGTVPMPHEFTFAITNAGAGEAAVAAHTAALQAEADTKVAKAEAAGKLKAEIEDALTALTTEDDDAPPAKQLAAIENYGTEAALAASEHVVGWLVARLKEADTPPVQLKCIAVLTALATSGSKPMKGLLLQTAKPELEKSTEFECAPHEKHGDIPQNMVHQKARECLGLIAAATDVSVKTKKVSTPGARKKGKQTAAEAQLVAGLKLEITLENASDVGFMADETLFVVQVIKDGLADQAGVKPGMSLVGFCENHVDTTKKIKDSYLQWTTIRKMASQTDFPHLYTFLMVDEERGEAAVDVFTGMAAPGRHTGNSSSPKPPTPKERKKDKKKKKKKKDKKEKKTKAAPAPVAAKKVELPAGCVDVEITEDMADAATKQDFVVDNDLWVCAIDAEGAAAGAGVTAGMSLVGFGKRALDGHLGNKTATWALVRQAAGGTSYPHVFSFADVDADAGKAAVAAHDEKVAAAAVAHEAATAAAAVAQEAAVAAAADSEAKAAKLKEEIEEALEMLCLNDESTAPLKQRNAIVGAGAGAGVPMALHVSQWLGLRLASAESPIVRLKAMELVIDLLGRGSKDMKAALSANCVNAAELSTEFRCEPHPDHGDKPQEKVRIKAQECLFKLQNPGKKWRAPKVKKQKKQPVKPEYVERDYEVTLGPPGMVKQLDEMILEVPSGGLNKAGFSCSPGLWVTMVAPEGLAEDVGVVEGMRLVGFQTERLDRTIDWEKLQEFASKKGAEKREMTFLFTNQPAEEVDYEVTLGPAGFVQQGKAEGQGVSEGMRLVGFQTDRLDGSISWEKLVEHRSKQAPPHTYTFTTQPASPVVGGAEEGVPPEPAAAARHGHAAEEPEPAAAVEVVVEEEGQQPAAEPEAGPAAEPEPEPEPAPAAEPEPELEPEPAETAADAAADEIAAEPAAEETATDIPDMEDV